MCYAIASRDVYKSYLHGRRRSQAVSTPGENPQKQTSNLSHPKDARSSGGSVRLHVWGSLDLAIIRNFGCYYAGQGLCENYPTDCQHTNRVAS